MLYKLEIHNIFLEYRISLVTIVGSFNAKHHSRLVTATKLRTLIKYLAV